MKLNTLEVNLDNFLYNLSSIKKYIGDKNIMPIFKANAYGTYLNKILDVLNIFDIVGVASVDEAIEIRKTGYDKDIFVLNQPSIEDINDILDYDIVVGISEISFIKSLSYISKNIRVHIEIETGMNRTGIKLDNLDDYISIIKNNHNIIVEGIYTHLSSADNDIDYTNMQIEKFHLSVEKIKNNFDTIKYIHSCASNGIINYNDDICNLVRPGIILYGYESYNGALDKIKIKPVTQLKTKINFLKKVNIGESISYSRTYISDDVKTIATIPIGYADGLRRELSNKGYVVVKGKKVKIVGNVCMDSCMIDVSDIDNVSIGTDVYIWDNDIQTLEDIAKLCNTINYEIMCNISYRVNRVFK